MAIFGVIKNAKFALDKYDYSGIANELTLTYEAADLNATPLSTTGAETHLPGLLKWSADLGGFWEPVSGNVLGDEPALANVGGAAEVMSAYPSAVEGTVGYIGQAVSGSYSPGGKVGDLAAYKVKATGSGRLYRANSLAARAVTATGNGTAFNLGAILSTQALYACLHVTSWSGLTSVAVKVQSAATSSFATPHDQIAFTTATDRAVQWATPVAGANTDTYWRVTWTVVGTGSATILVGMAIL